MKSRINSDVLFRIGTPDSNPDPETHGKRCDFALLKVHKIENFFDFDFGICVFSLLVMSNY